MNKRLSAIAFAFLLSAAPLFAREIHRSEGNVTEVDENGITVRSADWRGERLFRVPWKPTESGEWKPDRKLSERIGRFDQDDRVVVEWWGEEGLFYVEGIDAAKEEKPKTSKNEPQVKTETKGEKGSTAEEKPKEKTAEEKEREETRRERLFNRAWQRLARSLAQGDRRGGQVRDSRDRAWDVWKEIQAKHEEGEKELEGYFNSRSYESDLKRIAYGRKEIIEEADRMFRDLAKELDTPPPAEESETRRDRRERFREFWENRRGRDGDSQ